MQTTLQTSADPILQQVSERIEYLTGLHFPSARFEDLEHGLAKAAREAGCRDARTYALSLLGRDLHTADIEMLAGALTVGETHFLRDLPAFSFLETSLLPEMIAAKRAGDRCLRIWSAGCSTGEEPYSIAILLHRLIPDLTNWNITILGSDINPKVLARAVAGTYTEWSFRDTPDWLKPRYFIARPNGRYELQPWLKRMVTFSCLNLAEDSYPSALTHTNAMDLIICRNVLLYFAPARIPQVVQRFHSALGPDGQLMLGIVEASLMKFPAFTPVPVPGMALYRKGTAANSNAKRQPPAASETFSIVSETSQDLSPAVTSSQRRREPRAPAPRANTPSAYEQALIYADRGELAEARVWCERALALTKTDAALYFLHASILYELQREDETLLALRTVLFLDPDHVLAHFTSANLHRRSNRQSAAAKGFANVRRLLAARDANEEVPGSGGLTVGRLGTMAATLEEALQKERK